MYEPIKIENWYIEVNNIQFPMNESNTGAIAMLQLISKDMWWEYSETMFLQKYFNID